MEYLIAIILITLAFIASYFSGARRPFLSVFIIIGVSATIFLIQRLYFE